VSEVSRGASDENRPDAQHRPKSTSSRSGPDRIVDPSSLSEAEAIGVRNSVPPAALTSATIGRRSHAAAGLAAIGETVRFGMKEMGARRSLTTYLKVNKKDGFDCQSCAWPTPDGKRHLAEFCENGAKAIASEATKKHITSEFFARYSVDELAERSDQWLNDQGRLTAPMVLRAGSRHYEPIGWDAAFELVARALRGLESPNEATFYTSGRTSNEAAFLYQLFVRQFGTNNLPDCSNMCHESSGTAMVQSIGVGKSTVVFGDFDVTDTIFIIGQNPGTNHPRMLTALERAKRNGATIVSINPMPETGLMRVNNPNPQDAPNPLGYPYELLGPGTELSDLHLPVRVNGDVALLKGIMKAVLEEEARRPGKVLDRLFIDRHTVGFDAFADDLRSMDWDEVVDASGVPLDQILAAGRIAARAERMIACWAMGLTQHRNGVDNVAAVLNLLLLGGHIGRPGAGACCVRGHSNVQGDRTMGIWERMNQGFLDALGAEFAFAPPRDDGVDSVDSIIGMFDGTIKVFVGMGGNLLAAAPDTAFTAVAMQRCELTVQISTKLNRGHLVPGRQALILPCLGRSEIDRQRTGAQFVTVEDSLGVISSSRGSLEPASPDLRSEPAIVAGLAAAVLDGATTVDWAAVTDDYDRIRDHIANVVPGFEDFNARIKRDIFYLPNAARNREFKTDSHKANFAITAIPVHALQPNEYLLTTVRSHDQFNTTIYGQDDRYRGIFGGRRVIFLNSDDMTNANLHAGQHVDVTSHFDGQTRTAEHVQVVPYPIAKRSAAMYYPEANVLVPVSSVADKSNTPTSKSIRITLSPSVAV
jgi:molybdopterin-dependent oxidoreductase alpha subunit